MSDPLLTLERITMQFGGLKAVADLSLSVPRGELFGLIGPNGAGKTTVFNVITGAYAPTEGHVRFEGQPIEGLKPHAVAHRGITRTFQNIRLFGSRCCRDNVCIAAHQHAEAGLADAIFHAGRGPALRPAAPARDRARAGGAAAAAAAGRARRGPEPARDRAAHAPDRG